MLNDIETGFRIGDKVIVTKLKDLFRGYEGKVVSHMPNFSYGKEPNKVKVLIKLGKKRLKGSYLSNDQYLDYTDQELALCSKISSLLYG